LRTVEGAILTQVIPPGEFVRLHCGRLTTVIVSFEMMIGFEV
jgi:hypothetical protein